MVGSTNHAVATTGQLFGLSSGRSRPESIEISITTHNTRTTNDPSEPPTRDNQATSSLIPLPLNVDNAKQGKVTDIYFSPLPVTGSKAELSDPIPTSTQEESEEVTPTQETFDAEVKRPRRPRSEVKKEKMTLGPEHVDRLVRALADSAMVQQCFRGNGRRSSVIPPPPMSATPSLTSASTASTVSLRQFPTPPSSTHSKSPANKMSPIFPPASTKPLQVKIRGIAVTDPKTKGSPIRFVSKGYHNSLNVLHSGAQSFLNSPFGGQVESCIRIEQSPFDSKNTQSKVMLQVMSQVLDRWTGNTIYNVMAEIDVTDSFIDAALSELAAQSAIAGEDIEIRSTTPTTPTASTDTIDWCALADELEVSCQINSIIDKTAYLTSSPTHTNTSTCTARTTQLLTDLTRITAKHSDFLILQSKRRVSMPDAFDAWRMGIPWISASFESKIHDGSVNEDERRAFRERLIGDVAKRIAEMGKAELGPFATKVALDGKERRVFCVPVVDLERTGRESPAKMPSRKEELARSVEAVRRGNAARRQEEERLEAAELAHLQRLHDVEMRLENLESSIAAKQGRADALLYEQERIEAASEQDLWDQQQDDEFIQKCEDVQQELTKFSHLLSFTQMPIEDLRRAVGLEPETETSEREYGRQARPGGGKHLRGRKVRRCHSIN
ncbi:hypothetical protein LTR37_020369 [Vermiconidia calcicola]|uniref:Uncharacterized protein n=1 Tax=Vermiconidia calcicola TaxID=1690605 RepID=A0ACC3MDF5_9PEZI|nr:hypothetical protein LTR37_020369 [Vermiconidia calcicola]